MKTKKQKTKKNCKFFEFFYNLKRNFTYMDDAGHEHLASFAMILRHMWQLLFPTD